MPPADNPTRAASPVSHPQTSFAPPERVSAEELARQVALFAEDGDHFNVLDAIPDPVLVLNRTRQIVYANTDACRAFSVEDASALHGQRPGEALRCQHAFENEGGCGSTEFCSVCGAVKAIIGSLEGKVSTEECRITREAGCDPLDLRVWGTPLVVGEENFTIFVVKDIGDAKRRTALERTFFHDILNTAGGLLGYVELLEDACEEDIEALHLREAMPRLARQLIDEISSQRMLTLAESGELPVSSDVITPRKLLAELVESYLHHEVAEERTIVIDSGAEDRTFSSDHVLLARVLGNMLKNALEACPPGERVTMGWRVLDADGAIEFSVHNPSVMPREVQLQLFQRSFSTKGPGRGLGTYSIKLFCERYLNGAVGFHSSEGSGTTFTARVPL